MPVQNLVNAIENMDVRDFDTLVKDALDEGTGPVEILNALSKGLETVGQRFERGEYFLSELIVAGEMMQKALAILKPTLEATQAAPQHTIILGTIEGDMHSIGKDIIKSLLISAGFRVHDLGIDVPVNTFTEKAMETRAEIVGISALLSTAVLKSKDLIESLRAAGIRSSVKAIMGGAAVRDWMISRYGVDAVTNDAVQGLKIIKSWV
jgi:methanogenic corrinoid protein MtbC1